MITQQEINTTCECLLTKYTYAPYVDPIKADKPLTIYPEDLEFVWEFTSCTREDVCGDVPIRPKAKTTGNVMIYDCGTKSWVELNPEYITCVEHPLFHSCCETTTHTHPATGWDLQMMQFVGFGVDESRTYITSVEALESGIENLDHFDTEKYLNDIKSYVDSIETDQDTDPWSVNFCTHSYIIDWVALFEELDFSEQQLAENKLDMNECNRRWKLLIQQKAEEAQEFLHQQKQTLVDENSNTTRQELINENNEEIEELDAIAELIGSEIGDYQLACNDCQDIRELVNIWPPILMPMPYKRELVKVSALSAHDVNDTVDI